MPFCVYNCVLTGPDVGSGFPDRTRILYIVFVTGHIVASSGVYWVGPAFCEIVWTGWHSAWLEASDITL